MSISSTKTSASYPVTTTAAQNERNGNLKINSPGAAPGAANMNPPESIGFSRGQSLDHSVWYNGALMTFLATGEDTHGQFGLIEAVGRRGSDAPTHIHHREDEIFYILEGEIAFSVGDRTIKGTPGAMIFLPRDVRHSFTIELEQLSLPKTPSVGLRGLMDAVTLDCLRDDAAAVSSRGGEFVNRMGKLRKEFVP